MLRWLWLSAVVIVLDQASKLWANGVLQLHRPVEIFSGLNFTLSYNAGAAFSFLANSGGWQRWFFVTLAVLVSAYLIHWLRKLKPSEMRLAIALSLILGGAIGNVIDRVYLGYVVDFIDVFYLADGCLPFFGTLFNSGVVSCHWPTFNIADSAIFLGAVLLVMDSFKNRQSES